MTQLVENSANLGADFGGEWNGTASSLVVMEGPNFNDESAHLFPAEGFQGTPLVLAPGTYKDLTLPGLNFNDQARSIRVR